MASLHLQHMSHPHALNQVTLTDNNYLLCPICSREKISGEAYSCEGCKFYVHKSCAEAPPLINHPFHPQHPLAFKHESRYWTCRACNCLFYFTYSCDSCDFHLDVSCAIATLPAGDPPSSDDTKTIRHIAHEHPLIYFNVGKKTSIPCQGCREWVLGETYGCCECSFLLHKKCTEAPSEIRHPFHSQHPLSLSFDPSSEIQCKGCLYPFKLAYKCRECSYALDLLCVSSTLEQEQRYESVAIENFSHPHKLRYFNARGHNTRIMCMFCESSVLNEFYGCPDCSFFLHKQCAESGNYRFFQFFLQADCPFKFEERTLLCKCYICSEEIEGRLVLSYSQNVNLHISCAAQTSCYINDGARVVVQPSFHKHPMFICHRSGEEENNTCTACDKPVVGLAYICPLDECSILLHKPCAELQMEIKHSFHPQHPLSLLTITSQGVFNCGACSKRSAGFAYACDKCEFYEDTLCASENPSFKHPLHEHNLAYFKDTLFDLTCNACGGDCKIDFYRCVSCNFHLHRGCVVLPTTVKHKDHLHTLVLRDRYVEDDSGEYYCDICAGRRNPDLGVYVCNDCDYVIAHITCALSASTLKLKISDDLALAEADEEIASLLKEMEAIDAEINELRTLLEDAKDEHAKLCSDSGKSIK